MRKWFYSLYTARITYKIDERAKVVYIRANKPEKYWREDERETIELLAVHFRDMAYIAIVR